MDTVGLITGTSHDETQQIFEIISDCLDSAVVFGGAGGALLVRESYDTLVFDASAFYYECNAPQIVDKTFTELNAKIEWQGMDAITATTNSGLKVTVRFYRAGKTIKDNALFTGKVYCLGYDSLVASVITEVSANPTLPGFWAMTALLNFSGDPAGSIGRVLLSHFVRNAGMYKLSKTVKSLYAAPGAVESLPWVHDSSYLIKELEKIGALTMDQGHKDHYPIEVYLNDVNEDVCRTLYELIRNGNGRYRSAEALMVGCHARIEMRQIAIGVKNPYEYVERANSRFKHRGFDARVSYVPGDEHALVKYPYKDEIHKISIAFWSPEDPYSEDVQIGSSRDYLVGYSPAKILEKLAENLEKSLNAYDLVCFVAIYKEYHKKISEEQMEYIKHKCREAVAAVEDFGMAISLSSTEDDRILPDLDIFGYLADFETIVGAAVCPYIDDKSGSTGFFL